MKSITIISESAIANRGEAKPGTLANITVTTKAGDVHVFPAVEREAFQKHFPKAQSIGSATALAIVNAGAAVLSIPTISIQRVDVDGEEWWCCPV